MRITIALLLLLVISFQAPAVQADSNMTQTTVHPVVDEVVESQDTETAAERNGIDYEDGSILVVVELAPDAEIPSGYDIETVQTYSGDGNKMSEAWIPVDNVSAVSSEDTVELIRPLTDVSPHDDSTERTPPANQSEAAETHDDDDETPDESMPGFTYFAAVVSILAVLYARSDLR